jgi:hypothetical protein
MKFNIFANLALASQAFAASQSALQKRYPTGSFFLAYGVSSGPVSVFYSDGVFKSFCIT